MIKIIAQRKGLVVGNLLLQDNIIHPDYRDASPSYGMKSIHDLKAFIMAIRRATPDLHIEIYDRIADEE